MSTEHLKPHQFQKGQEKTEGSGRQKGTRNKISGAFLDALMRTFEASGEAALKIMAREEPGAFVKVCASLLPKEFSDEMPARVIITTGVIRDGETAPEGRTPSIPGPQSVAALPAPEAKAEPQPLMTADMVAELPRAEDVIESPKPEPAKVERREKLLYWDKMPQSPRRTGWR